MDGDDHGAVKGAAFLGAGALAGGGKGGGAAPGHGSADGPAADSGALRQSAERVDPQQPQQQQPPPPQQPQRQQPTSSGLPPLRTQRPSASGPDSLLLPSGAAAGLPSPAGSAGAPLPPPLPPQRLLAWAGAAGAGHCQERVLQSGAAGDLAVAAAAVAATAAAAAGGGGATPRAEPAGRRASVASLPRRAPAGGGAAAPDDDVPEPPEPAAPPPWWRRRRAWLRVALPLAASAALALAAAALLLYTRGQRLGGGATGFQAWRVLLFLAGLVPIHWAGSGASAALVWAVECTLFTAPNALYFAYALRRPAANLLRALLALGWWALAMLAARGGREAPAAAEAVVVVLRLLGCAAIFCLASLLKTLAAKTVATRLSKESHLRRMQDALRKEFLLHALLQPRPAARGAAGAERCAFGGGAGAPGSPPAAGWGARCGAPRGALRRTFARLLGACGARGRTQPSPPPPGVAIDMPCPAGPGAALAPPPASPGKPRRASFDIAASAGAAAAPPPPPPRPPPPSRPATPPAPPGASEPPPAAAAEPLPLPPAAAAVPPPPVVAMARVDALAAAAAASPRGAGADARAAAAAGAGAGAAGATRRKVAAMERYIRKHALRLTFCEELADSARTEEVASEADAKRLAFYLFYNVRGAAAGGGGGGLDSSPRELAGAGPAERLSRADLAAFFPGAPADAADAFAMLDDDRDGAVGLRDCAAAAAKIYRERRNLAAGLSDAKSVVRKLEGVIGVVVHLAAVFAYLLVWRVDVMRTYLAFSSLVLASSFVFGNSIRSIYENVVFLFVIHPYDVGDMLAIEDDRYVVERIDLHFTVLRSLFGQRIYWPNQKLFYAPFTNVSASGNLGEALRVIVDLDCPPTVVDDVRAACVAAMAGAPTEFESPDAVWVSLRDSQALLKITLSVFVVHSHNGEDLLRVARARTRLFVAIAGALRRAGVGYSWPPLGNSAGAAGGGSSGGAAGGGGAAAATAVGAAGVEAEREAARLAAAAKGR